MGSLLNRYCRSGRCESQYFVEDGGDRKDGKTKVYTFKEGIKRIEKIGKDDPEYKERNVKDRGIDGIIDWGYNMYGIFLIDADEVDDYKEGGSQNFDDREWNKPIPEKKIKISEKNLDEFELVDTDGVEYEIWKHEETGVKYRIDIDRSSCDFSGMSKKELINYLGYEEDQDYDVESLREQATDICNKEEEQDPDIYRDFKSAEIVK